MRRPLALTALCLVLFSTYSAEAQDTARSSSELSYAEVTFLEGQRLFFEQRCEEALPLFEESYRMQPSPNSLLYIARCNAELGELLQAYQLYRDVVVRITEQEEPSRYKDTQVAAAEERSRLRKRLGVVRVTLSRLPANLELLLGGRPVPQRRLTEEHFVDPGVVTVLVRAPGFESQPVAVDAESGTTARVLVVLPVKGPEPPPRIVEVAGPVREIPRHPAEDWAWVSAGTGVAGLVVGGVFAVQAERRFYRIRPACQAGDCPLDQVETGRRESLVSNLGFAVGALGLAGSGALLIWSRAASPEPEPAEARWAVQVAPGWIQVNTEF